MPPSPALLRTLTIGLLCGSALDAHTQTEDDFPDLIVDRATFTVDAQGLDPLYDVDLMIWEGALPDTGVEDTLRFFARHGTNFFNENYAHRMRCTTITWDILEQRYPTDEALEAAATSIGDVDQGGTANAMDVEFHLRDSLAMHYPEIATSRLHLLADTAMRFLEMVPEATEDQLLAMPLVPLRSLILPDRWYFYTLFIDGSVDGGFPCWWVCFQVDHQGLVQHWHEAKRYYAGSGQVRKL